MDEPFEGLSPAMAEELSENINRLRSEVSIIIIEHQLDLVLALADRIYILDLGVISYHGSAKPLLDTNHPDFAESLNKLGALYIILGRFAEAAPHLESALVLRERAYGSPCWEVGQTLYNLGVLHQFQGNLAEAEAYYRRALTVQQAALGPDHPDVADTLDNYTDILVMNGRGAEGARLKERTAKIRAKIG